LALNGVTSLLCLIANRYSGWKFKKETATENTDTQADNGELRNVCSFRDEGAKIKMWLTSLGLWPYVEQIIIHYFMWDTQKFET